MRERGMSVIGEIEREECDWGERSVNEECERDLNNNTTFWMAGSQELHHKKLYLNQLYFYTI